MGVGDKRSLVDGLTHRSCVEGLAEAAVRAALRNRFFIDGVIEDGVDIDEVNSIRNREAFAVRVKAVGGQRAGQILGAAAGARVVTECVRPAPAWEKIGRSKQNIGVSRAESGGPVVWVAPERMRIGYEVNEPWRGGTIMTGPVTAHCAGCEEKQKKQERRQTKGGHHVRGTGEARSIAHVRHRRTLIEQKNYTTNCISESKERAGRKAK